MDAAEEQRRGQKRKISLTRCDVCEAEEAKYRCPNCLKFSCSLPCVKQHKLQSGCSGVRDRTAFVPLTAFSDLQLLSDYRFLEETGRVTDRPNRDTLLHTRSRHSYGAMLLLRNAKAAKVNLKILPKTFSRRRENTSIYNKTIALEVKTPPHLIKQVQRRMKHKDCIQKCPKLVKFTCKKPHFNGEKKLYWLLKLAFPQSSAEYTDRVPEDRVLEKILSHYIHPTDSDPVKRQSLKTYVVAPLHQLGIFMKTEQGLPNSPKFHELDLKKSLRENLMFKTVVEYPELHVVVGEHREEYRSRNPERSITSPRPSSSSQARAAPESFTHTARPDGETTAPSELEEGEIQSVDEEDTGGKEEDQTPTGNAGVCRGRDDDDDDDDDDTGGC